MLYKLNRRTFIAKVQLKNHWFHVSWTVYKPDISIRRTVRAGPEGVCLRESWLYIYYLISDCWHGCELNHDVEICFGIHVYLAKFLITLSPNGPFPSNSFSKVAIIKTKDATFAFFLSSFRSPRSFLFSFTFPSLLGFWSFSAASWSHRKPAFWHLFTQMTANFVRLIFTKSARCAI